MLIVCEVVMGGKRNFLLQESETETQSSYLVSMAKLYNILYYHEGYDELTDY